MQNGKINPVAGIFLMKNNMNYTDQQEVVLKPDNPLGERADPEKLRLMRSLGARRSQMLWLLVFPANCPTLFNTLKVNVGLSWVGVIMGEFLVSRAGLGYLIVYGSQVFNMDLVMTSVLILALAAVVMYQLVLRVEKILNRTWGVQS